MANILTVVAAHHTDQERKVRYKVALSGAYVQAGAAGSAVGELINLGVIAAGTFMVQQLWGAVGPANLFIRQGPGGYWGEFLPGADGLHWILKLYKSAGTELDAGAYPAPISGDSYFYIEAYGAPWK